MPWNKIPNAIFAVYPNMVVVENYNELLMDLKSIIASSYLAQGFTEEFIAKVAEVSSVKNFSAGEYIVREDDETADLMILAKEKRKSSL